METRGWSLGDRECRPVVGVSRREDGGRRLESRGQRMETRGWSLEDRGWRPEVGVSRTEDGDQRLESQEQRMETRGWSLEDRGWRPEVGVSRTEDGDQRMNGGWSLRFSYRKDHLIGLGGYSHFSICSLGLFLTFISVPKI